MAESISELEFKVSKSIDEVYEDIARIAYLSGWRARRRRAEILLEGGRDVNWTKLALLLFVGLCLLSLGVRLALIGTSFELRYFAGEGELRVSGFEGAILVPELLILAGLLLGIRAILQLVESPRHRAIIRHKGDDVYVVYASSERAERFAARLLMKIGGRRVAPAPSADIRELYDRVLHTYTLVWGTRAQTVLERDIRELMGKGFTREDAIKELAKRLSILREGETGG